MLRALGPVIIGTQGATKPRLYTSFGEREDLAEKTNLPPAVEGVFNLKHADGAELSLALEAEQNCDV